MIKKFLKELSLPESYISITLGFLVVVVAGLLIYNNISKNNTGNKTANEAVQDQLIEITPKPVYEGTLPTTHTVVTNENLWTIALKYYNSGYNWVTIAKENKLPNPDYLVLDQKLTIPKAEKIVPVEEKISAAATSLATSYTVVKGDNLWNIAVKEYKDGFMWTKIAQANNLANPHIIHAGNVLKLPR